MYYCFEIVLLPKISKYSAPQSVRRVKPKVHANKTLLEGAIRVSIGMQTFRVLIEL